MNTLNYRAINRRQKKIERRNRKRKVAVKKRKIRFSRYSNHEKQIYRHKFTRFKGYSNVWAPKHFSLIHNTVETIGFIDKLEINISDRRNTLVRLTSVSQLDNGAIVVLLSVMMRFKNDEVEFNGDYPKNYLAKRKIIASGFIRKLYSKRSEQQITGPHDTIFTTWRNNVDSPLAGYIVGIATTTVYGSPKVVKGIFRVLIELMHNTHNHADNVSQGSSNWYLSIDHNHRENRVSFSFIDYGVGIFSSLESKDDTSKWHQWLPKMLRKFGSVDNAELMRLILIGELHATVTGQPFRGKGLPGIYETAKRGQIENLHILSNDVHVIVSEDRYELLPVQFSGTYVYFELTNQQIFYPWIEN